MTVTRREKVLLLLALSAFITFLSWRFLMEPALSARDALRERHTLVTRQLAAAAAAEATAAEAAAVEGKAVLAGLPLNRDTAGLLAAVGAAGAACGCFILEVKLYDNAAGAAALPSLLLEVTARGSAEELLLFIQHLESGARLLALTEMEWGEHDGEIQAALRWQAWYGEYFERDEGG